MCFKETDKLPKVALHIICSKQGKQRSEMAFDISEVLKTDCSSFRSIKYSEQELDNELAFICFSSGTTGLVKGVKLSQRNIVSNVFQHSQYLREDFNSESVCTLVLPFFHILGLAVFACQYVCQVSRVP